MAAWRREALAAFPELRTELNDADQMFSVYWFWITLLRPLVDETHGAGDEGFLQRAYAYAEWCHRASPELQNAVVVCFYEHLVDGRGERWWARVIPRLSNSVLADVPPEWEERLTPVERECRAPRASARTLADRLEQTTAIPNKPDLFLESIKATG
jgi:hypothetical protein